MKKIMTAALGLSLLSGGVVFAQDTATTSTDTGSMKSTKKHNKKHNKKHSDTMSTASPTK